MFMSSSPLLNFQRGPLTVVFAWLSSIQPGSPHGTILGAYPLDRRPEPAPARTSLTATLGPLRPEGICPVTGQRLSLALFRDLSCAILRDTPRGAFEVLPAALCLNSHAHAISVRDLPSGIPEDEKPAIRFQARPDGLYWDRHNISVDVQDVLESLARSMEDRARTILKAGSVADPRHYPQIPDGARFAPFSIWPGVRQTNGAVADLSKLVEALAALRAARTGTGFSEIHLYRQPPYEPWQRKNRSGLALSIPASSGQYAARDKIFDKALRGMLADPALGLPDNIRFGPEGSPLLKLKACGAARSAHERLEHIRLVSRRLRGSDILAQLT